MTPLGTTAPSAAVQHPDPFYHLVAACLDSSGSWCPPHGLDWDRIVELAARHRVTGLLARQVLAAPRSPVVPAAVREKLGAALRTQSLTYLSQAAETARLTKLLDPPERLSRVGLVYNGSFEFELSGAPFDWQLTAGRGTVLDIEAHPERTDARRLVVDVGQGRVEFGVRQMMVLGPGNYQFTAEMSGAIVGRRGLRWRMRCIAGSQIGETELLYGKSGEVLPVAMTFKVAEGCKAQLLSLELDARSASEQLVTGRVWFSALTVRPKDTLRP